MKKTSIIGIGDAGKYVINKIAEENSKTNTIYLSYDEKDREGCKAEMIINVHDGIGPLKQIQLKNNVIIISHLGDVERDKINREIEDVVKYQNSNFCEICLFPFTFEGKRRLNSAIETLKVFNEKAIIIDGDLLIGDVDGKTTLKELLNITYEMLYTNYKDYFASDTMKNKKYIVNFKEKEEEMSQRKIEIKKLDYESDTLLCDAFKRNKKIKIDGTI